MTNLYLDIETSGLSSSNDKVLIVGMLCNDDFVQLVKGMDLSQYYIDEFVLQHEPEYIVGYNSVKFDVPFLEDNKSTRCESFSCFKQKDLMNICHNNNLYGGLKKVEQILGIERLEEPLNYFQQKALWARWEHTNDYTSLNRFLRYNEEDVRNLEILEQKLDERQKRKDVSYQNFKKAFLIKHKK